ncbi:T9SS type A sorting domain-containing protein [Lacinutrix algicola]|uniref:T9SS type A sorting domain-containing protein n=1 Tax=Lacinutrix algicola TaxID=342954 RepID=UPI0006E307DA|nr:T9SS type A sorting domain-containing protein [Lacinutrix algicola]
MKKQLLLLSAFLFTFLSYSQVANMPTPLEVCDDASSDGIADFDLTISNAEVLGSQNSNDFSVMYYGTQMDADADMNPLPSPYANTSNPQTVYVRVEELSSGTFDTTTLDLVVNQSPTVFTPAPLEYCDEDNDGFGTFILTDADIEITQGAPGYTVTYYETMADATNNVNMLSNTYSNVVANTETLYARVENASTSTNCASFVALQLVVKGAPIIDPYYDNELQQCDELDANYNSNNDDIGVFDLTQEIPEITGGNTDYTVTFYETNADAQSDINGIPAPTAYSKIVNGPQTIYIRVSDFNTGCYVFTTVTIRVLPNPSPGLPNDLEVCDDNNDGFYAFDLTQNDAIIINGESGQTITYYASQIDAVSGTNAIATPTQFTNTNPSQTIYARAENNITGCFALVDFDIIVNSLPLLIQPSILNQCDVNNTGDQMEDFVLEYANAEILNGQTNITLTYFSTQIGAEINDGTVEIVSPYYNTANPQTVYVRAEDNDSGCVNSVALQLTVSELPTVTLDSEYSFCAGESVIIDSGFDTSTGNYSFDWYMNGIILTGETGPTLTVVMADVYDLYVLDNNTGCNSGYTSFTVTEVSCVDSDADGVTDTDEDINGNGNLDDDDTDMDTIPNYLDDDDDGDNVPTIDEIAIVSGKTAQHTFVDTDNDLIENYLDDDDDGDGVLTINEDYNNNGDPTDDDTDASGTADYLEVNVALSTTEFNTIDFAFYPNPATSILNIKLNNASRGNATVEVIDIQGKMVISTIINQTLQLDVKSLMSGLYFVKLKYENTQTVKKLIIE